MEFPIVIHYEDGKSYGVTVPDLPGCFSAGDTLNDVFGPHGAREAILLHVEGILEDGEAIPERKSIEDHRNSGEFAEEHEDVIWGVVDVDLADISQDRAARIQITLPSRLLAKIDRQAKLQGKSRSAFLVDAAEKQISAAA